MVAGSSLNARDLRQLQKDVVERNWVIDEFTTSERDGRDEAFETRQALAYASPSNLEDLLPRS